MLTRSRSMAAPEAADELARMERVNDSPRPTTTADTAPKPDPTIIYSMVSLQHQSKIQIAYTYSAC